MKRIPAFLLAFAMLFAVACGQNADKPTGLNLSGMKTEFTYGEAFTADGLTVAEEYADGRTRKLSPDEYTVDSSAFKKEAGTYTVTVTASKSKVKQSYEVTVLPEAKALALVLSGQKREFKAGEAFSVGKLSVIEKYSDGSSKILTAGAYTVDSSRYDKDADGLYTITVRANESGIAEDYTVSVVAVPVSLSVSGQKTSFEIYEKFGLGGAAVTAKYSNGQSRALDPDEYAVDLGGFVRGAVGAYTITVSMKSAAAVKASYTVNVVPGDYTAFTDGIKILAIGNSFSDNAMLYLYGILDDLGIENVTIANLYIAGCSLNRHATIAESGTVSYTHKKNTDGAWKELGKISTLDAIESEEWDYIVTQQASGYSGKPDTYNEDFDYLIDFINQNKLPETKIVWHMTWAYQADSNNKFFPDYGSDQMNMYTAITDTTKQKVLPKTTIDRVIPAGTVIQNLRTSYIGDTLTADGYHLKNMGCYAAGLSWAKTLTGWPIDSVGYMPADAGVDGAFLTAVKEAVNNAHTAPYAVTDSAFTTRP